MKERHDATSFEHQASRQRWLAGRHSWHDYVVGSMGGLHRHRVPHDSLRSLAVCDRPRWRRRAHCQHESHQHRREALPIEGFTVTRRFEFRNPPRWVGRLFVALAASLPGALAGGIIALWAGHFVMCVVVGVVLAAIAGAAWET